MSSKLGTKNSSDRSFFANMAFSLTKKCIVSLVTMSLKDGLILESISNLIPISKKITVSQQRTVQNQLFFLRLSHLYACHQN